MKWRDIIFATLLLGVSISMMIVIILTAIERKLSVEEAIYMQAFSIMTALGSSYFFSRQGSEKLAKEMFAPHARSAFRRIVSLFQGISHIAEIIDSKDDDRIKDDNSRLLAIKGIAFEQIRTANDALEDWREVIPEAVARLERDIPGRADD